MVKIHKITTALLLCGGFLAVQHVHAMLHQPDSPFQQPQQPYKPGSTYQEPQLQSIWLGLTIKNLSDKPVILIAYYDRKIAPKTIEVSGKATIRIPFKENGGKLVKIDALGQTTSIWKPIDPITSKVWGPTTSFEIYYKTGKWRISPKKKSSSTPTYVLKEIENDQNT